MYLLILIVVLVLVIGALEYYQHDCIDGKRCKVSPPETEVNATPKEAVIASIESLRIMYSYSFWRQALLVSLIVTLPIFFVIKRDFPNIVEFLIVMAMIFIAVYFSYSWMWTHFIFPSSQKIENGLRVISRKI